jgi:hypothetical protein
MDLKLGVGTSLVDLHVSDVLTNSAHVGVGPTTSDLVQ